MDIFPKEISRELLGAAKNIGGAQCLTVPLSPPSSHSKVVRRVSVNERSSLYRREHHKEAKVWQERGRQPEPQDDDEDRQTDNELHQQAAMVSQLSFVLLGICLVISDTFLPI